MASQTTILIHVGVSSVMLKTPYHSGLTKRIDDPEIAKTMRIARTSQLECIPHLSFNFSNIFLNTLQNCRILVGKLAVNTNYNRIGQYCRIESIFIPVFPISTDNS